MTDDEPIHPFKRCSLCHEGINHDETCYEGFGKILCMKCHDWFARHAEYLVALDNPASTLIH